MTATATPRMHATMSRLDNSIVAVHEDSPEPSAVRRMTEGATANLKMLKSSNQRAKNQFRPRVGKGGATSYQLRQYAEVTLGGGSLRKVVKLPEGEDENEWLAVNSKSLRYTVSPWHGVDSSSANRLARSGRLLQPNQPALRRHYRVLLAAFMPRDESYR